MKSTTHSRISATLSKDLLAQVDALVKASDDYSNRSVFIEKALEQFLKTHTSTVTVTPSAAAESAHSPPPAEHHGHEDTKPKEHHGHSHESAHLAE